jgi:hypothetical protein
MHPTRSERAKRGGYVCLYPEDGGNKLLRNMDYNYTRLNDVRSQNKTLLFLLIYTEVKKYLYNQNISIFLCSSSVTCPLKSVKCLKNVREE